MRWSGGRKVESVVANLDGLLSAAEGKPCWLFVVGDNQPPPLPEPHLRRAGRPANDLRAARLLQSLPWRRLSEEDMKGP